jgi:hypothetical protein
MVIMTPNQGLCSDEFIGPFGRPAGLGAYVCGANRLGEYSEITGVYQRHLTKKGLKLNLHRDNFPSNPRTPAQQAWRDLFRSAMTAWKALDAETKLAYNKRVYPPGQPGQNRFIKEYIKLHR